MIKIIDTYPQIETLFDNGIFNIEKWELYINSIYANSAYIFKDDLMDCLDNGDYTYEKDVLPILNAVFDNPQLETLHSSFCRITEDLNKKILDRFGCELNVDIVLYIGLCNAAGWVTTINGKRLKVYRSQIVSNDSDKKPGTVVSKDLVVKCGSDAVKLVEIQAEGSKRMNSSDYLRGKPVEIGTVLGE